mgnify:FL=1
MTSIGKTIAFFRKKKGMTQSELAEKMHVTDKAVSKWERDLSCPDVNTIAKLADILEVSVEELLNAKKYEYQNTKIKAMVNLVLKAVAVAMGIGVAVLTILKQIEITSSIILLGIGITCIGIYLFNDHQDVF